MIKSVSVGLLGFRYIVAGKAIGFALEQTLSDAALTYSAPRISKRL
ncbi:MAG: hypothetical protein LBL39_01920 [Planctomycetaceae bacterium]|jgi:hypothetical protein|nr:hypothetical protein [Planctomycetaceae bacterium]